MTEDNLTKCSHGITKADRRIVGCRKCDAESHEEFLAAQEAARFRVRVINTARSILPAFPMVINGHVLNPDGTAKEVLRCAESFERKADEYLKG